MAADQKRLTQEFLRRCEAVGWQVVRTGGDHFKVDTRRGTFTVASTPNNSRPLVNALATAKRYGLEELERKIAARSEKTRLERIELDRKLNDARTAAIVAANGGTHDDEVDTDVPVQNPFQVDLGSVDGVAIAAVGPVNYVHPRSYGEVKTLMDHAEELLLANGRVVYRCTYLGSWKVDSDPTKVCHATFETALSLNSHHRFHASAAKAAAVATPTPPKELDDVVTDKTTQAIKKIAAAYNGQPPAVESTPSTAARDRELLLTTVDELAQAVLNIGGQLVDVRNALLKLKSGLDALQSEVAPVDPELIEKAARYDALAGTLKNLIQ